jgi:hypothetical protein
VLICEPRGKENPLTVIDLDVEHYLHVDENSVFVHLKDATVSANAFARESNLLSDFEFTIFFTPLVRISCSCQWESSSSLTHITEELWCEEEIESSDL